MRPSARFVASFLAPVLSLAGIAALAPTASANPAGTGLVINEVYNNGGSAGATYTNKFVELYNPTASPITFTGSVQYRSATGTGNASGLAALNGVTIGAQGYYLIQGGSNGANGVALPTPDATSAGLNMAGAGGTLFLTTTTSLTSPATDAGIVDKLGFGTSNSPEATAKASGWNVTTSISRTNGADTDNNNADFTAVTPPTPTNSGPVAPAPLAATNPGNKTGVTGTALTSFQLAATGGTAPYSWGATGLPAGVSIAADGTVSGTPTAAGTFNVTATVTDSAGTPGTASTSFTITVSDATAITPIATIQGTAARSTYAPASGTGLGTDVLTTQGVITAVYKRGFNSAGTATCGFCGYVVQDPTGDLGDNASDAVFVYGGSSFTGKDSTSADLAVGQSVRVSGKVSEFGGASDTETLTELNQTAVPTPIASLGTITPQTTAPTTYAGREAHEDELFAPTDLVVTDHYNLEGFGELGVATGNQVLQQPGQICRDGDSACITAAQTDIKNRGYFMEDGTNTTFLSSAQHYRPQDSKNSDIPLPFIDKDHSARVGAHLSYPQGAVLHFANKKWYLDPPRAVLASHNAASPDLGTDVVTIENTRPQNQQPAATGGNMHFATYNVENFFSIPMQDFAAANPWFASSGPGCEYDYDRAGNPILSYQCTSPTGLPTAWDPVTGAVTAYGPGLVNAPRGAGRQQDLDRQTSKIVTAISRLGADVVALEEIGNPNKLKLGVTNSPLNPDTSKADLGQGTAIQWRDATVSYLVDHLNAAAGSDVWAFAASPEESTNATASAGLCSTVQPNGQPVDGPANLRGTCSWASGQDVIRSAYIYKKASVVPVGPGALDLPGSSAPIPSPFDNAREPFAQYFKPVGARNDQGFALIVNHFKSKGDSSPAATGGNANDPLHGAFNASRVAQAHELVRFANEFAGKWHTQNVFLLGDFNAYSGEDPVHAILDDPNDGLDFEEIHSDNANDTSYVFTTTVDGIGYGGAGSLDHIFASAGARSLTPHTDIWEINANEPDVYDYGRYNTNKTDFWDGGSPWRGSDHNPEIIGLDLPSASAAPAVTDVQIVGQNDFHGRLVSDANDGGAAPMAGAINSLRNVYGANRTVFVSGGDNIGASTFESFTQHDKPSLEALSAMGLDFSAVGNHEMDRGWQDLLNRIEKPYDATTNPYGAAPTPRTPNGGLSWTDLMSNVVYESDPDGAGPLQAGDPIVAPTAMKEIPNPLNPGDPIKIGFVGGITHDLTALQSPDNLEGLTTLPTASTVNDRAAELKAQGADLIMLLVDEGSASTDCSTMTTDGGAFADILNNLSPQVDAVMSAQTHLEYSCSFPVQQWIDEGRPITTRPVIQAGAYGNALGQFVYSFDATNTPVDLISNTVGVKGAGGALFNYPQDPVVKAIVDQAVADAAVPGAAVLGKMDGPLYRSKLSDGVTENRGGESTLGNQIAEIQRWETRTAQFGSAQIGFMNPGGIRADALGTSNGGAYDLTYREAADVQPFANELVNMQLTGAQIKKVLEQQWQRDASGNIPARPFLKLGISAGFTYTYSEHADPDHPGGSLGTVTGMWLNGQPISLTDSYSVTVNSFLSTGGDNFWELDKGAQKHDVEVTDLQSVVEYMKQYETTPLAVDASQRGIRVTFPDGAPESYGPGDTVSFDLGSLDMNAPGVARDDTVNIKVGDQVVASGVTVTHGNGTAPDDRWGTASVSFVMPDGVASTDLVRVLGATTGTDVVVPVTVRGLPELTTATPTIDNTSPRSGQTLTATPGTWEPAPVALSYQWLADGTPIAGATSDTFTLTNAQIGKKISVVVTGTKDGYQDGTATSAETAAVARVAGTVTGVATDQVYGKTATMDVAVTGEGGATPTGTVSLSSDGTPLGSATLGAAGTATVTIAAKSLPANGIPYHVTLTYSGDDVVAGDLGSTTLTVSKAAATLTGTSVHQSYGATTTMAITASADGVTPGGKVTLTSGGVTLGSAQLSSGAATVTIGAKLLAPSSTPYPVTIAYAGDTNVAGSTTASGEVTVDQVTATVTGATVTQTYGKGATMKVTVTGQNGVVPTGSVTLKSGTVNLGMATLAADGTAVVQVALKALAPSATAYPVTITYSGDANVMPASGTASLKVVKAPVTISVAKSPRHVVVHKTRLGLVIKVVNAAGVVSSGTVNVSGAGIKAITKTLSSGKATVKLPPFPKAGKVWLKVRYNGNTYLAAKTVSVPVVVSKS